MVNGGAMVVPGVALAAGVAPRLSAANVCMGGLLEVAAAPRGKETA